MQLETEGAEELDLVSRHHTQTHLTNAANLFLQREGEGREEVEGVGGWWVSQRCVHTCTAWWTLTWGSSDRSTLPSSTVKNSNTSCRMPAGYWCACVCRIAMPLH